MTPPTDWMERGRDLGAALNAFHSVVLVGSDAVATAEAALGAARQQSEFRRVVIGDLFGDAPPLLALINADDPHGLSDSFQFGVSLNKIAQMVPGETQLFILPSGSAPLEYEELLPNVRWQRLSAGFREVDALLILVVPVEADGLRSLVEMTDGLVIVGEHAPPDIPVARSIAWLRPRRSSVARASITTPAPLAASAMVRAKPPRNKRRIAAGLAGLTLSVGLAAGAIWFARRPFASERPVRRSGKPATAPVVLVVDSVALAHADSVRRDSVDRAAAAVPAADSSVLLTPANSQDSAGASRWAVQLERTNTTALAILDLRDKFERVPAGTYGFDPKSGNFLVVGGAYQTRAGAESLLVQLRMQKVLAPGIGSVTSLPFAFLVEADVPQADVARHLARFAAGGRPVYALRQNNGAVHLYFGAYESPRDAALADSLVRKAGLTPTLVYRIGRVY
ncbi:MAG: Sporulation protein [Gemmatimonadetes bacterium]|nr:Sporulation protein [Gemmatimonadota bacterium]